MKRPRTGRGRWEQGVIPTGIHMVAAHVPGWMLVLTRLTGIFLFSPMLGSRTVPANAKIFLALGLSFCVYPTLLIQGTVPWPVGAPGEVAGLSLWSVAGVVGVELLIGLVIGYGASMPLMGVQLGGRVIDQQMGLGLASVLNPEFNEEAGIVSEVLFLFAMSIFLTLGGHRVMLATLVGSFGTVPLGGLGVGSDLLGLVVGVTAAAFDVALRVAGPVLCLMLLETLSLGFIAKTVPQMNILSVGFVLRILIGAAVLIGSIGVIGGVCAEVIESTLEQVMLLFMR